ncbi:TPA: hypothetical protein SIA39_004237 [Aeromonas sobria]|nr:hypothetical protein [Aeromonas sobria]
MIKVQKTEDGFNVYMDTGDDCRLRIKYKELNTDNNTGVVTEYYPNLTNISITGTARTAYNVDADKFTLPITKGDQTKEPGYFYLTLSNALTAEFRADNRPRKFQFDLQSVDANGWTQTFCKGTINFNQDNTF